MHKILEAEMLISNVSKRDLAAAIGKSYSAVAKKLRGTAPFTYDEAIAIQERFFPDKDIRDLFGKQERPKKC